MCGGEALVFMALNVSEFTFCQTVSVRHFVNFIAVVFMNKSEAFSDPPDWVNQSVRRTD